MQLALENTLNTFHSWHFNDCLTQGAYLIHHFVVYNNFSILT